MNLVLISLKPDNPDGLWRMINAQNGIQQMQPYSWSIFNAQLFWGLASNGM